MKRILCTGAGGSASNNFIRSLRLAPEPFYIVGVDTNPYYLKLSPADKNYLVPNCHDENYIPEINRIIEEEKLEFIHCQPDPEVEVLSKNSHLINALSFIPSDYEINLAHNKMWFNYYMSEQGVPVPKAWMIHNPIDVKKVFNETKEKLWLRAIKGAGSLAALPVTEEEQAVMWIDYWSTRGITWGEFMISEFLPGKEYAFQSVWYNGKLITSAARERIDYLFQARMPSGQSSTPTLAKSVHNDKVNLVSTKAIQALSTNPHGVYCVDLKEDYEGNPKVTEINLGRFFTTSLFFTEAGSNMPYYYIKLGYGEELGQLPMYNAVDKDLYWARQIDCSQKLIRDL